MGVLTTIAVLLVGGWLLGRALDASEARYRREWARIADQLHFQFSQDVGDHMMSLRGSLAGFEVQVIMEKTVDAEVPAPTVITLDGRGRIPRCLTLAPPYDRKRRPSLAIGHPAFERRWLPQGPEAETLAVLGAATRQALLGRTPLSCCEDGILTISTYKTLSAKALSARIQELAALGRLLSLEADTLDRLERNATSDPLPAVRLRNAEALLRMRSWSLIARELGGGVQVVHEAESRSGSEEQRPRRSVIRLRGYVGGFHVLVAEQFDAGGSSVVASVDGKGAISSDLQLGLLPGQETPPFDSLAAFLGWRHPNTLMYDGDVVDLPAELASTLQGVSGEQFVSYASVRDGAIRWRLQLTALNQLLNRLQASINIAGQLVKLGTQLSEARERERERLVNDLPARLDRAVSLAWERKYSDLRKLAARMRWLSDCNHRDLLRLHRELRRHEEILGLSEPGADGGAGGPTQVLS